MPLARDKATRMGLDNAWYHSKKQLGLGKRVNERRAPVRRSSPQIPPMGATVSDVTETWKTNALGQTVPKATGVRVGTLVRSQESSAPRRATALEAKRACVG